MDQCKKCGVGVPADTDLTRIPMVPESDELAALGVERYLYALLCDECVAGLVASDWTGTENGTNETDR